ncbi:MAG: hypothetical protein ACI814_000359 [Mariniblastus sp.]|jgi:hypothetical protein
MFVARQVELNKDHSVFRVGHDNKRSYAVGCLFSVDHPNKERAISGNELGRFLTEVMC